MQNKPPLQIIDTSPVVELLLDPYREALGSAFVPYRGHIYRVLTYSLYLLAGDRKYQDAIEAALVFHDLAALTGQTMQYLEPSVELALEANQAHGWGHDPVLLEAIILYHHKITPYRGPYAPVVNAVRCGDWIEVSQGRLRKGVPKHHIAEVNNAIPWAGFDKLIACVGVKVSGSRAQLLKDLTHVFKI